jgi:hypothetical protein
MDPDNHRSDGITFMKKFGLVGASFHRCFAWRTMPAAAEGHERHGY